MTNFTQAAGLETAFQASAQFLQRHEAQRLLVAVVEAILKKDGNELAAAMQVASTTEGVSLANLVIDIKSAADDFHSLGDLFDGAAARLEALEVRLT
jgi:hypothetical protein